jgi:16S rRNA (cytosine1402-N4)-methyltransferase
MAEGGKYTNENRPSSEGKHLSVMVEEALEYLALHPGMVVVDATLGAGGLAERIADRIGEGGRLIAIDRDPAMIKLAGARLTGRPQVELYQSAFSRIAEIVNEASLDSVEGIVFDLGLNSIQLADPDRGFSFRHDGPLDMRFDPTGSVTAAEIVNRSEEIALADILYRYGGERRSRRIAHAIVQARSKQPIQTTGELAGIVERAVGRGRLHPATKTFQALRIVVNEELSQLEQALQAAEEVLAPGGRIVVISFHSLEDRIVKQFFAKGERQGDWQRLTKKVVKPSAEEVVSNSRARSAKLRAAKRQVQ